MPHSSLTRTLHLFLAPLPLLFPSAPCTAYKEPLDESLNPNLCIRCPGGLHWRPYPRIERIRKAQHAARIEEAEHRVEVVDVAELKSKIVSGATQRATQHATHSAFGARTQCTPRCPMPDTSSNGSFRSCVQVRELPLIVALAQKTDDLIAGKPFLSQ